MEQDKEKIKRKAKKVVDNLGNVNLATLETSLEIVDKLEDVVETLKGHHQEMMDKPEKEMPEVSLEETNTLLKELLDESKKKEEYTYDIEIDPALKAKLKGEKGDTVYVDKIIEKTEVIREIPIVTNEVIEVAKYEEAEQIREKLETLKDDERLDISAIKGVDFPTRIELHNEISRFSRNTGSSSIEVFNSTGKVGSGSALKFIGATVSNSDGHISTITIDSPDLSGYVPYTGATTDVDLGAYTITTPQVIGSTSSGGTLTLQSTSHATKGKILFGTSAYDEVNDRLGIGTATPTSGLHISKPSSYNPATASFLKLEDNTTSYYTAFSISNDGKMRISSNSSTGALFMNTFSNKQFLFNSYDNSLTGFNGGLIFNTYSSTDNLSFQSGSVEQLNISNGKVLIPSTLGIGTTSPTYKLDVNGTGSTGGINTNIGLNLKQVSEASNTATYTIATGGSVDTGLHYYSIVFYTAIGDTAVSNRIGVTTTAGNNTVNITNIPVSSDPSVIGRKIYRSKLGEGSSYGWLVGTIADNTTTTFSDTVSDASRTDNSGNYNKPNTTNEFITINDAKAMVLDSYQTIFGKGAGVSLTTGAGNMLFGPGAGNSITTGEGNVVIGPMSLGASSIQNTVIGYVPITAGNYNTGIGNFIWQGVGYKEHNIAIGYGTATQHTSVSHNIAIGSYNLSNTTTGDANVSIGGYTMSGKASTSKYNVAIGFMALYGSGVSSYNVSVGMYSGWSNTTGSENTFLGYSSGYGNTTGSYNTFIGNRAGYSNSTTDGNVFLGYTAGYYETGANKFFIDNQTRTNEATARTSSLLYGVFDAVPGSQTLQVNAGFLTLNNPNSDAVYRASNGFGQGYRISTIGNTGGGSLSNYDGSGTALTWGNSNVTINGSLNLAYVAKTANYTLASNDYLVNATANSFDFTLPTAVGCTGRQYILKNSGTGIITVKTTSSQLIDGNASGVLTLVQYDSLKVMSDGANWIVI